MRSKANDYFLRRLSRCSNVNSKFILRGGLITRQFIYPVRRWSADIDFISLTPVSTLSFFYFIFLAFYDNVDKIGLFDNVIFLWNFL